jgi:hypothetical protein
MDAPRLYAAYGSNLDHARMLGRCGGAVPAGTALLPGWRLVVNRFASIVPDAASVVPLGLWHVTPGHIAALDVVEGVAVGAYRRIRIRLPEPIGDAAEAWTYVEQNSRAGPPAGWYVAHLRQGYRDFSLDPSPLEAALAASRA